MSYTYRPEYAVRNPDECPTVRPAPGGDWVAEDSAGRSARGGTPADAITALGR
ncbi:hypothetical protein [Halomicrococcus sp. NG-SE-24]|uniref:hypothetical protein n=1 Tax=Halomicrococcus sp. NG-SE-24 TaxID=3436928 RepID=UPI003D99B244